MIGKFYDDVFDIFEIVDDLLVCYDTWDSDETVALDTPEIWDELFVATLLGVAAPDSGVSGLV